MLKAKPLAKRCESTCHCDVVRRYDLKTALKEPLTDDERNTLLHIYRSRLRLFVSTFAILFFLAWVKTGPVHVGGGDTHVIRQRGANGFIYREYWSITINQFLILMKVGLLSALCIPGAIIYSRRIAPYRRDARIGLKAILYHTVIGKRSFATTGQYFLLLDNPDCMHHEVDAMTYEQVTLGQMWPMYFGPCSGYAFNPRGTYSPM